MGKLIDGEGEITIKTCNDSFMKAFVPFYRLYRGRCNMNRCKWNNEPFSKYNAYTEKLLENINIY